MAKSVKWHYAPYKPFLFETRDIYICRVVPEVNEIHFEWLGIGDVEYNVYYRKRIMYCVGEADLEFKLFTSTKNTECTITGLEPDIDYEFYVEAGSKKSRIRIAHTGEHVGIAVNYVHPEDKVYSFSGNCLCSPSMVRHPDGYLLSSMDLFKAGAPQNLTLIFRSDDEGKSWHYVSELYPCFWGKMFIHRGALYMLSASTEYGDLLIGRSDDGGKTFTEPSVLLRGSSGFKTPGVHKNPQNIMIHNGRIYETLEWGTWALGFHAVMVMSCPEDADLLDADNWSFTEPVMYDETWPGTVEGKCGGNIEGTLVVAPDGQLYNMMRYVTVGAKPNYGYILAYKVNTRDHTAPLEYSHSVEFPANLSKFTIKKDPLSEYYYTIADRITNPMWVEARNLLSLMKSKDLKKWEVCTDIIDLRHKDARMVGVQYVDYEIEGDDIIFVCRTAMNGAENFHNSNYQTFHKIENFRKY
ncbi:MAG: hypothetical protein IJ300_08020 [Clostridia bacterium]|nr:hypothetical protein [Clostridia bacterium]